MITKWEEVCIEIESQKKTIDVLYQDKEQLSTAITSMKEEISVLTSKLEDPIKTDVSTTKVIEQLHMDLMVHMQVKSIGGKMYVFVCVDDYSRFTWVKFIIEKSYTFKVFKELCQLLQREKGIGIVKIISDHGRKFENSKFSEYCASEGIGHEFSALITPCKMGWWKGRIKLFKSQPELCYMPRNFLTISGLKQWIQPATFTIE